MRLSKDTSRIHRAHLLYFVLACEFLKPPIDVPCDEAPIFPCVLSRARGILTETVSRHDGTGFL